MFQLLLQLLSGLVKPRESNSPLPEAPPSIDPDAGQGGAVEGPRQSGDEPSPREGEAGPGSEAQQDRGVSDSGLSAPSERARVSIRSGVFDAGVARGSSEPDAADGDQDKILIHKRPSPNFSNRNSEVFCSIVHFTAGGSTRGTLSWLANRDSKVSAHAVIGRQGGIYEMVDLDKAAWHAGRAKSPFGTNVNSHSIGIELCNWGLLIKEGDKFFTNVGRSFQPYKGPEPVLIGEEWWEPYDERQLQALERYLKSLKDRGYPLAAKNLFGHNEVSPGRKIDPGPHFPWERFRS